MHVHNVTSTEVQDNFHKNKFKFTTLVLNIIPRKDNKTRTATNNLMPMQENKYHQVKELLAMKIPSP